MSILIHLGVIIVSQLSLVREYAIPRYLIKIVEHYMAVRILIFFWVGGGRCEERGVLLLFYAIYYLLKCLYNSWTIIFSDNM